MKPLEVIGVGEGMLELSATEPLGAATHLRRAYGGDVLNSLVTLARLGRAVGFVSRVGDDPFGPALRDAWAAEGIDLRCCPLVPGENGVYFISRLPGGEREFSYRRSGSAASGLAPADLDAGYLGGCRVLLLSGVTQAISATAQAATLHAARLAKGQGVRVAYDPNFRPALWAVRGAEPERLAAAAFAEVLPYLDILLPSSPNDLPVVGGGEALEVLDSFVARGLVVGVKVGSEGAYVGGDGKVAHVPAARAPHVLDSTGAGDTWNAGFLHALLAGRAPMGAARYANALAAWTVGHLGAIPADTADMPLLAS